MGMNKMFKKVLAVVAAGAMTMGMAMPTFAAEGGKVTEAYVSKTYNTEVGKAEKFSFTATQVKAGTGIITRMLTSRYQIFHLQQSRPEQQNREQKLIFRHFQRQVSMNTL